MILLFVIIVFPYVKNVLKREIVCEINKIDLKEETFLLVFLFTTVVFCNFVANS